MKRNVLTAIFCLIAVNLWATGFLVTCDVGGATYEYQDDIHRTWQSGGTLPRLFNVPKYDYVLLRVHAAGYKDFEQGYTVDSDAAMHVNISLESDGSTPNACPLFAVGGYVKSKTNKPIVAGQYLILVRNLTTYHGNPAGQDVQDIITNEANAWFSGTIANPADNRAVAVGDRLFIGVFSLSKQICYGFTNLVITEENVLNAMVIADVKVK